MELSVCRPRSTAAWVISRRRRCVQRLPQRLDLDPGACAALAVGQPGRSSLRGSVDAEGDGCLT
jgi:hypothetical protein